MIKDAEIARDDLIVQDGSRWNVNSTSVVGYNDYSSRQDNIVPKCHISSHSEVIKFKNVRRGLESRQKVINLRQRVL